MRDEMKKVPRLRFRGFSEEWEQCKLGDLGSVAMNKRIFKEQTSESGVIPFNKIGTFAPTDDAIISRELFE
ncbi:restriction endonuclease subunit S, partial [Enterococcus faecium]